MKSSPAIMSLMRRPGLDSCQATSRPLATRKSALKGRGPFSPRNGELATVWPRKGSRAPLSLVKDHDGVVGDAKVVQLLEYRSRTAVSNSIMASAYKP